MSTEFAGKAIKRAEHLEILRNYLGTTFYNRINTTKWIKNYLHLPIFSQDQYSQLILRTK